VPGRRIPRAGTQAPREDTAVSVADDYLSNNAAYALTYPEPLPGRPARQVAIVACMDARLAIAALLGMNPGEAHVMRNAGGVVTDDVIRSLAISQRLLGTTEIILIHHTDCGLLKVTEDSFKRDVETETGIRPPWAVETFTDVYEDVRQSKARILASPFIPHKEALRGFVFDVTTGRLNEVS
jgi:carbonic anhydrase